MRNFAIVTICGSTKFKDEFIKAQKYLTLQGCIVLSVGLFGHSGDPEAFDDGNKEMLDDMHKRKIEMSHGIFVVNKDGYIGKSTKKEIEFAMAMNKWVVYLEELKEE